MLEEEKEEIKSVTGSESKHKRIDSDILEQMNYNSNFRNPKVQVLPDGTVIPLDDDVSDNDNSPNLNSLEVSSEGHNSSSFGSPTQNNPMDKTAVGFDVTQTAFDQNQ